MSRTTIQVDARRSELLETNARAFAAQLRAHVNVRRNWIDQPKATQAKLLRNDWGAFSFTQVEQPQDLPGGGGFVKSWKPQHYLLMGVLMRAHDVAAMNDFPLFMRRVAHHLGAPENALEMRSGRVVEEKDGLSEKPVQGTMIIDPASRRPDEVLTIRWNAA